MSARKLRPWDADTTMSKAALERLARALVACGGHFTDAMTLYGDALTGGRSVSLFLRVWLPDGQAARFQELAKLEGLRPPPRVQVGLQGWRCAECGARCPSGHCGGSEWRDIGGLA